MINDKWLMVNVGAALPQLYIYAQGALINLSFIINH